jgi:thymidylate synthase (FAD)
MEVKLVDCMPRADLDAAIVQAARVSYGPGTKTPSDDRALIRYLMRHKHTTPFEMVEFKFRIRCPIFVARQHMRHRTASINEISARYSVIDNVYYTPSPFRTQSSTNKQGSEEPMEDWTVMSLYIESCEKAFATYNTMLDRGVSRELARGVLPQSTYTEFYWKINLHNLLHYLKLRMDGHAQKEIQDLAKMIYTRVKELAPLTAEAFEDYVLNSLSLSGPELSGGTLGKREMTELGAKVNAIKSSPYI